MDMQSTNVGPPSKMEIGSVRKNMSLIEEQLLRSEKAFDVLYNRLSSLIHEPSQDSKESSQEVDEPCSFSAELKGLHKRLSALSQLIENITSRLEL